MQSAITDSDKKALVDFIQSSDRYTCGPKVKQFEDEWSKWLVDSSFLTSKINSFQLSQTPIISSLVVYVDFEIVAYGVDWDYDEETNTIRFTDAPEYGQVVAVGYDVQDI